MTNTYKVMQDGLIVPVQYLREDADGRKTPITEATVAYAGDEFDESQLPPSLVAAIEAGEREGLYGRADDEVPVNEDRARDNARRASGKIERTPEKQTDPDGGSDDEPVNYSDSSQFSVDDLKALVEERQIEVEGTGANGNQVRADLEKALAQADLEDADDPDGGGGD